MEKLKVTNEQIIEAWTRLHNYAQVGRELGIRKQTVMNRVMRLRAMGVDLPPSRPVGYTLTSERARIIARLRGKKGTSS